MSRNAHTHAPMPPLAYFSPVRSPLVLVTGFLVACGGEGGEPRHTASAVPPGPDPVVVRIPRAGGVARAYLFSALDASIWKSSQPAPALERVLAFDQENGLLAFVDTLGIPGWIDLRLGVVRRSAKNALVSVASSDGWAVFGVSGKNDLVRLTPSGDWQISSSRPIRRVIPTPDGTVLLVLQSGKTGGILLRMRPPDDALTDSASIPLTERAAVTPVGDRVYLGSGNSLLSVIPDAVADVERFAADGDILALAPTPSGDRLYIANASSPRLERFNRYTSNVDVSVRLPGLVTELRMDPFGRYLLARPVAGDSAWVVSVATEEVLGAVATAWRSDLPTVSVDGRVATVRGGDVALVDPRTGEVDRVVANGAADHWFFARWNGFRPRARGIDQPVSFTLSGEGASIAVAPAAAATTALAPSVVDSPPIPVAPLRVEPSVPAPSRARTGWTVSFAAVLSLERARDIAAGISVDGVRPRIVAGETEGATVYRVVLGPYDSKDAAERAGRSSSHSFWVFEGVP